MARNWENHDSVRAGIHDRMARFGMNHAQYPYVETQELREGQTLWSVDIHVKVNRECDFELFGEAPTLSEALRRVYLGLNNEVSLRRNARQGLDAIPVEIHTITEGAT